MVLVLRELMKLARYASTSGGPRIPRPDGNVEEKLFIESKDNKSKQTGYWVGAGLATCMRFHSSTSSSHSTCPPAKRDSSSLTSFSLHLHVTFLAWCDTIKLSNLLLPRKSVTIKRLQLLSTPPAKRERSNGLHLKLRPDSGVDCLICAIFARQRSPRERK